MHMNSTINIWIKYNDVNYRRGEKKYILTKGNESQSLEMPSIILDRTLNKVVATVDYVIDGEGLEKIEKKINLDFDIPIAKWFNLTIVTKNGEIQGYLNGKLKKSIIIKGHPKYNNQDAMFNYENGFNGFIKNVQYYDTSLSTSDILKLYYLGPLYDGNTSFLVFLLGSILIPLKLLGKLFVKLFGKLFTFLNLDVLLGLNVRAIICDKNRNQ